MSVLAHLVDRIRCWTGSRRALAVFDLDSTLLTTQQRNFAILREYAARPGAPVGLLSAFAKLRAEDMGWNVMQDLHDRGFQDREVLRELRAYWFARFFQSEYLRHDLPVPGAAEYVKQVHDAGATVYYLTGRDVPNMLAGTQDSLRANGFPLDGDRVVLKLKPRFEDNDLVFKRSVLAEMGELGDVACAFENEPANANMFLEAFPEATVVLLETIHSPNPPPLLSGVARIRDFR
jgi:hypothetical protein